MQRLITEAYHINSLKKATWKTTRELMKRRKLNKCPSWSNKKGDWSTNGRNLFNLRTSIKPCKSYHTPWWKYNSFLIILDTGKQGPSHNLCSPSENPSQCNTTRKRNQGHANVKGKSKTGLFSDMIVHTEKSSKITRKVELELKWVYLGH